MKVLVTGTSGQLGHDVAVCPEASGHELLTPSRKEMDLSDVRSAERYLALHRPDLVIHCAAWTDVDGAETDPEACRKVNVEGTRAIADYCGENGVPMMYISTDYVFNGSGERPWETDDPTDPVNVYGLSKRDGEDIVGRLPKHYIVRISWVFGSNGRNFVRTMVNLSAKTDTVRVVADQFGSPTYTADLAPLLWEIAESGKYGTYHAHNGGYCSWYDVAAEIFRVLGTGTRVIPISSAEYPVKAERPKNSRLSTDSLVSGGFRALPGWEDAIRRYIEKLTASSR